MKHRISDLFALFWPLFIILTPYVLFAPLFPSIMNYYLLTGLLFVTGVFAFYLYRTGAGRRDNPFIYMLRFFLILMILDGLAYKALSGEFFARSGTPLSPGTLLTLISCAAGWGLTLFFAKPLVMRDKLITLFAPYEMKKLAAQTRKYSYELQEMRVLTTKLRRVPTAFLFIALAALLLVAFVRGTLYAFQIVFVLLLFLFGFSFLFHMKGTEEELLLMSDGIRLEQSWLSFKGRRFFLILLLLAVPSLFLARWEFTLPLSLIGDFFGWLGSFFTFEAKGPPKLPEMPRMEQSLPVMNRSPMFPGAIEERGPLLSEETKRLIKQIFAGLGAAAFLLFLISPFLSRSGRRENGRFLRDGWNELTRYLSRLFDLLRFRGSKPDYRDFRRITGRKKKRSADRGGETSRNSHQDLPSAGKVIRTFEKICRWGKKRGEPYSRGTPPAEYLVRFGETLPRRQAALIRMGDFLNRYFYSENIITTEEIDDFVRQTGILLKEEKKKR
jgi:hypothetical protein